MAHLVVDTCDLDEASAFLFEHYSFRIDAAGVAPGLRLVQDTVSGVTLSQVRYAMHLTMTNDEPLAGTCVARLRSGRVGNRYGRRGLAWSPGDVFVGYPNGATVESTVRDCELEVAVIAPAAFAAVARTAGGDAPTLTGLTAVSAAAERRWLSVYSFARQVFADLDAPSLMARQTARLVAATALDTFPNDAALLPTAGDRRDASPTTVRRAVSFMEAHPDADMTVVDIAHAAHVTPRALQLAFRRHLDTTPMAYLRRLRLDRAHHDLRAADPAVTTVTAVAAQWGFADLSRFTHRYRDVYGQNPSDTLYG